MLAALAAPLAAQDGPLRIEITEGVIEPIPIAIPDFVAEGGGAEGWAEDIARVVAADLTGTGVQDTAIAVLALELALEQGSGTKIDA